MNTTTHPAAERYLKELERALSDLPRPRRDEIIDDIRGHIDEAVPPEAGEAQVRTVLEDLGDPETIAADARERFGITKPKAGALEGFAIAFLLVGGVILPVVGWIMGAVLLWMSRAWNFRDKFIGTLVVPGGLALAFYFGLFATGTREVCEVGELRPGEPPGAEVPVSICSTEGAGLWGTLLLVVLVIAPIATAIYLGRRAWTTS